MGAAGSDKETRDDRPRESGGGRQERAEKTAGSGCGARRERRKGRAAGAAAAHVDGAAAVDIDGGEDLLDRLVVEREQTGQPELAEVQRPCPTEEMSCRWS